MKFEALKRRVERSEALVEGRREQTRVRASAMKAEWRDAWTPGRIILAGLASGFAAGHVKTADAVRKLGGVSGSGLLGMVTAVSRLVFSVQATIAAVTAKDAAETADAATEEAKDAVEATIGIDAPAGTQSQRPSPDDGLGPGMDPGPSWTAQAGDDDVPGR